MNIRTLNLPASPVNVAVNDIETALKAIVDLDEAPVFALVRPGLYLPDQMGAPDKDQVPACHIWHDVQTGAVSTIPMIVHEMRSLLSLYIIWYDFGDDGGSIQALRQELCEYVVKKLQQSDLVPDQTNWWWPTDWDVVIDHTNAFKRLADNVLVLPPWYASRIDLQIMTRGVSNTLTED